MKKLKYLLVILLSLCFIPAVNAASASMSLSGTTTITEGSTTKIYLKITTSDKCFGANVNYSTTGNISVTNVAIASGFTQMGKDGNKYILYSSSGVNSGSSVLVFTVKGTGAGTGTLNVGSSSFTIGSGQSRTTATSSAKSTTITVKAKVVETEEQKAERLAKEAKAKEEAEAKAKEEAEAKQKKIDNATTLVKAAETSLLQTDYDAALAAVKTLDSADQKSLLTRLDEVKFDIAVNKAKGECNCETNNCEKTAVNTASNSIIWIVISSVLGLIVIVEAICLAISYKNKKNHCSVIEIS